MYESELYELFIAEAQRLYGVNSEDKAYKYLKLRFLIYNSDKKTSEINTILNLARFLMSELNIPLIEDSYFIYKGERISISNDIYNIIQNWEFRASLVDERDVWQSTTINKTLVLPMNLFIDKAYNEIIHTANIRAKKLALKNKNERNIYLKYFGLLELNNLFNAVVLYPKLFIGIEYGANHNPYTRTLEEKLEGLIHYLQLNSKNVALIGEDELEDYLVRNIEKIEEGLKYIDRQVVVDGGRIDILARDKNGVYTIIELKVEEDKELVWQCLYYPDAIKEKYKTSKVRMITLCPEYKPHIMKVLSNIKNLELYKYEITLSSKEIKDIYFFNARADYS